MQYFLVFRSYTQAVNEIKENQPGQEFKKKKKRKKKSMPKIVREIYRTHIPDWVQLGLNS